MTQILFLRVGIDRGCGGMLSPRFLDGGFEYVPILEFAESLPDRVVTYADIPARSGGTMDQFSGSKGYAHYDPEFETYTYGEPNEPKRSQLLRLYPGDYLVFYAGFRGPGNRVLLTKLHTLTNAVSNHCATPWPV